ncbi:hypothetical protein NU08_1766 [Flavobacterium anhuiense]|uniref:Uncharacterized protein n=1 Tax=Flavobacterium anhuiense TaxID=459526 RepID=A0A444W1B6_9FLAO|nr:hypothetical protein [Flavobacterium anhuiense]RYJ39458.1 hypothetical protein NU08_1766 [Flavobacterium anhuiense]
MYFLGIDFNRFLMRLPSSNSAERIDFEVAYSLQALNVRNEIQALISDMTCLGSFFQISLRVENTNYNLNLINSYYEKQKLY